MSEINILEGTGILPKKLVDSHFPDGGVIQRSLPKGSLIAVPEVVQGAVSLTLHQFIMTRASNGGWLVQQVAGLAAGMQQMMPLAAFSTFDEAVVWLRQRIGQ